MRGIMEDLGREICILSLGQILAVSDESIGDAKARETLERHVRQIAAIIQEQPFNKPDELTDGIIKKARELIRPVESPARAMESVV